MSLVESDVRVDDSSQRPGPHTALREVSSQSRVEDVIDAEVAGVPRESVNASPESLPHNHESLDIPVEFPLDEVVMEAPVDDKPMVEKKEEDEVDLYDIKNFSL